MLIVTLHYSPALVRRSVFAYLRRGIGTGDFVSLAGLAVATGFRERAFFGHRLAYVIHFEKPEGG